MSTAFLVLLSLSAATALENSTVLLPEASTSQTTVVDGTACAGEISAPECSAWSDFWDGVIRDAAVGTACQESRFRLDPCACTTVTCQNVSGASVTQITVANPKGTLPNSIGQLTGLVRLDISSGLFLSGTLPASIGLLSKLTDLFCSRCDLRVRMGCFEGAHWMM